MWGGLLFYRLAEFWPNQLLLLGIFFVFIYYKHNSPYYYHGKQSTNSTMATLTRIAILNNERCGC